MKRFLSLFLSVVLLFLLTGCGQDKATGCTIYYPIYEDMTSFDPQIASADVEKIVVLNCFEGLVTEDENGSIQSGIAERWTVSSDGKTYTFYLRDDAVWYLNDYAKEELADRLPENFAPSVTADDFVFAMQRAVSPATGAKEAYLLAGIENAQAILAGTKAVSELGVTAVDAHTLQISLAQAQSNFLSVLTEPIAMPCCRTFFEACDGRYGMMVRYMLTNGSFSLAQFVEDTTYTLKQSTVYTGSRKATPAKVILYVALDGSGVPEKITDEIYSGAYLTQSMYDRTEIKKSTSVTTLENITYAFVFNTDNELLAEPTLRKAFCQATDTIRLAGECGKTYAETILPSACDPDTPYVSVYDDDKAGLTFKAAVELLGIESVSLTLLVPEEMYEPFHRYLQEWQKNLGIGFALHITAVSETELRTKVRSGQYDIALYPIQTEYTDSISAMMSFTRSDGVPYIQDEIYTRLLADAMTASDADTLQKNLNTAGIYLVQQGYILPLYTENSYLVQTTGVSGIRIGTDAHHVYFHNAFSQN